ncbi:unnamed protein product [Blepharisma stoltei]|uniref:Uncharacterized protein n=1 Tax=Blepharisma stoltei TaxID=1481888 RepID=A0AAU9JHJ1_9CILI|nr:unnamed protein product [Blepharisma stoltei]
MNKELDQKENKPIDELEELEIKDKISDFFPGPNEDFEHGKPGSQGIPFKPNPECKYCHGSGYKEKYIGKHKKHIKRVEALCNRCAHASGMCSKCLGTGFMNPGDRKCFCIMDGMNWRESKNLGAIYKLNYPNGYRVFAGH